MGIIDKRRTLWRDLVLFRRSPLSSSCMLKAATSSKTIDPPQHSNDTAIDHNSHHPATVETTGSPLMNESEHGTHHHSEIIDNTKQEQHISTSHRVSFSPEYKCVYITQRTEAEKNASFYSQEEYNRIDTDNADIIMKMMEIEKKYPASETQYYRGLLIPRARYERDQRVKFVVSNVLREQERNETLCEEWIIKFSKKYSSQTAIAALHLGKIDAMMAARGRDL
mmetsp:Transcript_27828/g.67711  ORF Transcript_27828/g.67711 Transcript_27828/m.67711 type:complete len:224 (+) Transcript_27828:58-729(+)|eukprot:CAMPEP_0113627990 /NCGR_PEP_ID=MMETSP0017_2-20120614/14499_1 /TAXON_ID=2856 /ORGANISM="Cylindrotheca closterium" /LENGTH=223 /DNA_ID=CAMNT_0000538271 /DNA_START=20 /DNA_END=691 /DNA_ORIENTATION=+ /assembly_acc=CAM_ASM_000147